jgi:PAS domain S-box-containing protein
MNSSKVPAKPEMETELLRAVVESSLDAIVCVDEDDRIILWNEAAEQLFGYTREEALGMPVTDILVEKFRKKHLRGLREFLTTGRPCLIGRITETEGLRKDGSTFAKEMSLTAARIDGRWVFTAMMRDISERKRYEQELHARMDEIERMNRLMVGRELKMEDLRKTIRRLQKEIETLRSGKNPA